MAVSLEVEMALSWAMTSWWRVNRAISCLFQASSLIIRSCSLFSIVSKNFCCIASCLCITCFINPSKNFIILPPFSEIGDPLLRLRLSVVLDGCPSNSSSSSSSSYSCEEEEDELFDEKLIPTGTEVVAVTVADGIIGAGGANTGICDGGAGREGGLITRIGLLVVGLGVVDGIGGAAAGGDTVAVALRASSSLKNL